MEQRGLRESEHMLLGRTFWSKTGVMKKNENNYIMQNAQKEFSENLKKETNKMERKAKKAIREK